MLLSIAIFPLVKDIWWEKNRGYVVAFWSLLFLIPFAVGFGIQTAAEHLLEVVFGDYVNSITAHLCKGLTGLNAVTIPNNVINIEQTFSGCTSLTGTITINSTPDIYGECLLNTNVSQILGSCTIKDELLATK